MTVFDEIASRIKRKNRDKADFHAEIVRIYDDDDGNANIEFRGCSKGWIYDGAVFSYKYSVGNRKHNRYFREDMAIIGISDVSLLSNENIRSCLIGKMVAFEVLPDLQGGSPFPVIRSSEQYSLSDEERETIKNSWSSATQERKEMF